MVLSPNTSEINSRVGAGFALNVEIMSKDLIMACLVLSSTLFASPFGSLDPIFVPKKAVKSSWGHVPYKQDHIDPQQ